MIYFSNKILVNFPDDICCGYLSKIICKFFLKEISIFFIKTHKKKKKSFKQQYSTENATAKFTVYNQI